MDHKIEFVNQLAANIVSNVKLLLVVNKLLKEVAPPEAISGMDGSILYQTLSDCTYSKILTLTLQLENVYWLLTYLILIMHWLEMFMVQLNQDQL